MWSSSAACRLGKKVLHSLLAFAFQSSRFLAHLKQVLPQFIADKRPLLVFDSADGGVVHQLGIKLHQLHAQRRNRAGAQQPTCPGEHIGDAALERRGEPVLTSSAIVPPGFSVPRLTLPPTATNGTALLERFFDDMASMREFGGKDHLSALIVDDGHSRRLAAWVELEAKSCSTRLRYRAFQDDREGESAPHRRLP